MRTLLLAAATAAAEIVVAEVLRIVGIRQIAVPVTAAATAVEHAMSKKVAITILVVLGLIAAAFLYYWYGLSVEFQNAPATYTSVADMNTQTAADNPAFAAAVQYENAGDWTSAITQLQIAQSSAKDEWQRVTIFFHLAQDEEYAGTYTSAVQQLQQIAADGTYPAVTRAYATEQLGVLYASVPAPEVSSAIFANPPYSSLYVSTSTNLTTRRLFQYATTIYPLPVSQYYIANTYLNAIFNLGLPGATSAAAKAQLSSLEQEAASSFEAADASLASVSGNPPTPNYVFTAQLIRAVDLGKFQQVGTTTLGDADQAFQSLLSSYASQNLTADGAVRLQYAYFLANVYGTASSTSIQSVLAPVVSDSTHRGALVGPSLAAQANLFSSQAHKNLVLLSSLDPQFKQFLVSLGWTSADFATSASPSGN